MVYTRRKLYIENMLSQRCRRIVETVLEDLGLDSVVCRLGEVDVDGSITSEQRNELKFILSKYGFKLLGEEKTRLIERILALIAERFYQGDQGRKINFSDFLVEKVAYDYHYLANLFSRIKGITLENYIIAYKIERVKEFLLYDDCDLKEISYKLEYSSVAHLSTQFKKVTGITPTKFRGLTSQRLNPKVRINTPLISHHIGNRL